VLLEEVVPVLLGALAIGADLHGAGVPAFGRGALGVFDGVFHAGAADVEGEDQAGRTVRLMRSSSARSAARKCSGQLLVDMAETATLRT
jgi:hypothetical protein